MCLRSLISLRVLLASILLSNAFPIFLMATSSRVSAFVAALEQAKKTFRSKYYQFIIIMREACK
ncbi:hypothetical protein Hanom_Chr04g00280441 [Helianthus anomalus]